MEEIKKPRKKGSGGFRAGAGRHPGKKEPRNKNITWRVTETAIETVKKNAEKKGLAEGEILNWLMINHGEIPDNLKTPKNEK